MQVSSKLGGQGLAYMAERCYSGHYEIKETETKIVILERLKQIFVYAVVGTIVLFLAVQLFKDPVGAAHVVGGIVRGIGHALQQIWTFFTTLWSEANKG
jgi:hypothetical protein